ncbi:hypothetical protein BC831DRAFT_469530 [Entophlyctis helioformis]|nr:hypothetical protein BC831DRAFT_469530 [Entophlyctis helioformis]
MDGAAHFGRLHIVQWLHANRTEGCTTRALDWAAEKGHLHVIQWLLANRTEGFTADAIINAKTDEIAAVLVKSLTPERRNAIAQQIATTGNTAAINRILSLLA